MKLFLAVSVVFLLADAAAVASLPQPPEPPAGWEAKQTPGFDPSVESVLVETAAKSVFGFTAGSAGPLWAKWGTGAADVLLKLLRAPEWKPYQTWIAGLLFASPFPETRTRIHEELYRIAEGHDLRKEDLDALNELLRFLPRTPDSLPVLVRLSKSPHAGVVASAAFHLALVPDPQFLAAARDAIGRLPENKRKNAQMQMDHGYAQLRAQEPLATAPKTDLARPMRKGGPKKVSRKELKLLQERFLKGTKQRDDASDELVELARQPRSKGIVEFFVDTAANPELHAVMREKALFALGRVGTKESVAAWKSLRDAARAKPGAPQLRQDYTHAQRMYEAAVFVLRIIPGLDNPYQQLPNPGAWVSPDYAQGAVLLGDVDVKCLRYSDEWMPVEKQTLPPP